MNEDTPNPGREVLDDARQEAGRVARRLADEGRTLASQKKATAAGQVDALGRALHRAAGELQGDDERRVADLTAMAADQLQSLGRALKDRSVDDLLRDSERLARRSPGTFFAGSVAVGFLLSRFLKSSQERRDLQPEDDDLHRSASGGYASSMDDDHPLGAEAGMTHTSAHHWPTDAGRHEPHPSQGERHAH